MEELKGSTKNQNATDKPKDEISQLKKSWYSSSNSLISLLTLVLSFAVILILFVFNSRIDKKSTRLEDKIDSMSVQIEALKTNLDDVNSPILTLDTHFITRDQQFGLILRNKGGGSAFIKSMNAKFNGKWYRDLCNDNGMVDLLKDMGVDGPWTEFSCYKTTEEFSAESIMGAGDEIYFVRVVKGKYNNDEYLRHCKKFGSAVRNLYVEIEYCTKNGECEWMKRDFAKESIYLDTLPD